VRQAIACAKHNTRGRQWRAPPFVMALQRRAGAYVDPAPDRVLIERGPRALVQQYWKGVFSYGTVGLELALSVVVGLIGGQWLDRKLGTDPWLTFIGLGFGIAAGARSVWRAVKLAQRQIDELDRRDKAQRKEFHDGGDGER
jgi:F0F1-type ATP synthase assembly protein I